MESYFINFKKNKFVTFLFFGATSLFSSSDIFAAANLGSTYVGTDLIVSNVRYKKDYGDNIYNKNSVPGVNVFFGKMFTDNYGVEVGYEVNKVSKRDNVRIDADLSKTLLGVSHNTVFYGGTNYYALFDTQQQQKNLYIGALHKANIFNNNNLFASVMLGLSLCKVKSNYFWRLFSNVASVNVVNPYRYLSKNKIVPLVKFNTEYKFNNSFSVRALIIWKNMFSEKVNFKYAEGSSIKLQKNQFNFGIGLTYYFG